MSNKLLLQALVLVRGKVGRTYLSRLVLFSPSLMSKELSYGSLAEVTCLQEHA